LVGFELFLEVVELFVLSAFLEESVSDLEEPRGVSERLLG